MRSSVCLALWSLAAIGQADRLIHIPTGKKVPNRVFRLEGGIAQSGLSSPFGYLDAGLTPFLDATLRTTDVPGQPKRGAFDIGYNYIAPLPNATPGISVGVQDASNSTADGRRFYFASTFRVGLSGSADSFTPAEVTLGAFLGKKDSALVGVMMPLTSGFRLMAEHDGYRLNSGLVFKLVQNWSLKYVFIGSTPQLSAQVQSKF